MPDVADKYPSIDDNAIQENGNFLGLLGRKGGGGSAPALPSSKPSAPKSNPTAPQAVKTPAKREQPKATTEQKTNKAPDYIVNKG